MPDIRPALVLIDLQHGIVPPTADTPEVASVIGNAAALAGAFTDAGLPVVLVTVDAAAPGRTDRRPERADAAGAPAQWTPDRTALRPELAVFAGTALQVRKKTWGAFHGTDLDRLLRERGVTQVVLGGVATGKGVESTARSAHEHGYDVVTVTDACWDRNPGDHDHSVSRIFPEISVTATTAQVLAEL